MSVAPRQRPNGPSIPRDLKQVVAKVFDPMFYGKDCGSPFHTPREQADGNLSREAGAYNWAIKFNVGKNKDGSTKFRCVGLVLMEYVPCISISKLCSRDEYSEFLVLEEEEIVTSLLGQDDKSIPLDLDFRKAIMRMAIRGIVQHLHIGVEHYVISPESLFIVLNGGPLGNLEPRAVMLDYSLTQIWSKTKWAADPKEGPKHCLQLLPHPVHPLERFSAEGLEEFIGWYPLAPNEWSEERQEYSGPIVDNEGEFTQWLINEFGPLAEGQNHKGEYYSTFATLDEIESRPDTDKESRELKRSLLKWRMRETTTGRMNRRKSPAVCLEFKWINESGELIGEDDEWEDMGEDGDGHGGDVWIEEDDIYDP
ncbi:hypothetical protein CSOJ01_06908 [Colletotrichum sojae]|uniref:Uncharacterized protein n=1 Tax=Colletotrichum sojae TaxID=2175907 RepID=A0A8H6JBB3_9PEZI|nr:hypothetical protein CSOJ01_06908 [Colletotrichum sojae]